ncbi:hypothetical protein VTL71DRAFT_13373 [Oculimacula yallundae]|uniref:MYND-type domain-containing protein n=1 Tax=Oculimacula yallundae TaxID=86028 RepID=A0ABR4CKS7_9HELO
MSSGGMDDKVVDNVMDTMKELQRNMQRLQATVESDDEELTESVENGEEEESLMRDMDEPEDGTPLQENSAPGSNADTTKTSATGDFSLHRVAAAFSSLSPTSSLSGPEATLARMISNRMNRKLEPPKLFKCQKCNVYEPQPGAYMKCGICKTTAYCGGDCKKADRKEHRANCARLAEAFKNEVNEILDERAEEHAIGTSANQQVQMQGLRDVISQFNKEPEDAMLMWIACFQLWVYDGYPGRNIKDCNDPSSGLRLQLFRQFLADLKSLDKDWAPWLRKRAGFDKCMALASDKKSHRFVGKPASPGELASRFGYSDEEAMIMVFSLRQASRLVCGIPFL